MPSAAEKETIKFYAPNAARKQLVEKVPKWRGDHSQCNKHRSGECAAPYAWVMINNTWVLRPDMAGVSIEPNMLGTSLGSEKGSYPVPVWQAKGWLDPADAEGVVPTEAVKRFHINRLVDERRINLEHKKAEFAYIEADCAKLRAAAEAANGLGKKAKSDG